MGHGGAPDADAGPAASVAAAVTVAAIAAALGGVVQVETRLNLW